MQAFTDEAHSSGLEYLKKVYGARVVGSKDLAREWGATRPSVKRYSDAGRRSGGARREAVRHPSHS